MTALVVSFLEGAARFVYPKVSNIQRRFEGDYASAAALRGGVLVVGNSLTLEGVNMDLVAKGLPEWKVARLVSEDTGYLDWLYVMRRLIREGSEPKVVLIGLRPRHLLMTWARGLYFGRFLLDRADVLDFAARTNMGNTDTTAIGFANLSAFLGIRQELNKYLLTRVMPAFPKLASSLRGKAAPIPSDDEIARVGTERLRELKSVLDAKGIRLILFVPPSAQEMHTGIEGVRRAGEAAGVDVVIPIPDGTLEESKFTDGFHLAPEGRDRFTEALVSIVAPTIRGQGPSRNLRTGPQ